MIIIELVTCNAGKNRGENGENSVQEKLRDLLAVGL